jgi:hypothetical protein
MRDRDSSAPREETNRYGSANELAIADQTGSNASTTEQEWPGSSRRERDSRCQKQRIYGELSAK